MLVYHGEQALALCEVSQTVCLRGGIRYTFTELSEAKLGVFVVKQLSNSKQEGWTLVKEIVHLVI